MNFFESQDRVRKNTLKLVILFALAVITLIIMTNLLVMLVFGYINSEQLRDGETLIQQIDWQTFITVGAGVSAVILVGSLYKIMALSAGGKTVAESLGGQLIPQDTEAPDRRKLLNVVEEMAIASGTPVPPVYLLADEPGINAFAAGFTPRDAVIGVTQGTIEHLNREQLQGVIAHEFSHIFNGDMRLNIRLMGVLNGILIIGMIGYYILYSTSFSRHRRGNDKGAGGILALAIGLMVIGFAGTFFGGLIKASVSRQREYLADASAVQFTRNPDGIAGALKRIGSLEYGSKVANPGAPEVSHAFFAQGISGFMQTLSATHPPLAKRIQRIDPHWDGKFDYSGKIDQPLNGDQTAPSTADMRERITDKVAAVAAGAAVADVMKAIDQIGNPQQETINYARTLISELPLAINEAAREPYGARAVIYSLVLDKGQAVRDKQIQQLHDHADPAVCALTLALLPEMTVLDIKYRLPLIDITIPTLKQLSISQYKVFRLNLIALVNMDSKVELLEWSLQNILLNHLDGQFFKLSHAQTRYYRPVQVKKEIELVLSVLAYAGQEDQSDAEIAFDSAARELELSDPVLQASSDIRFSDVDSALEKLAGLKPSAKLRLLKACVTSIVQDQVVSPVEIELLRTFSDVLECPMPLVV